MPQWRNSNQTRGMDEGAVMKVGDLVREKQFPEDACGIIVEVGDLR